MAKQGKGSAFEREICKTLSRWWSKDKRDDIFWRTSGSGARAKTRNKTGQSTFGQYGDIQATDPIGQSLISLCTIELKRGYATSTFADLAEPSTHLCPKPCAYEKFIQQVVTDSKNAKTHFWMLIVKRNRREAFVLIPIPFYRALKKCKVIFWLYPKMRLQYTSVDKKHHVVFGTTLFNFLDVVKPNVLRTIYKGIGKND